jgi:surface protein
VTQAAAGVYGPGSISAPLVVTTPPPQLSLDSNGVTVKYIGGSTIPSGGYKFITSNIRGGQPEVFAVMNNSMITTTKYQLRDGTYPVPPNNIVTTLVTNMDSLFANFTGFNQPISSWDTSNVTNMYGMFRGATAFNQDISKWDVQNVANFTDFKIDSGLSIGNTPPAFLPPV